MQLAHPERRMGHADENCRSHWNESLNLAERHLKRLNLLTDPFQHFERGGFIASEEAWRQQGDVGGQMR